MDASVSGLFGPDVAPPSKRCHGHRHRCPRRPSKSPNPDHRLQHGWMGVIVDELEGCNAIWGLTAQCAKPGAQPRGAKPRRPCLHTQPPAPNPAVQNLGARLRAPMSVRPTPRCKTWFSMPAHTPKPCAPLHARPTRCAKARMANPARQSLRDQPRTANPACQSPLGHPRTPKPAWPTPHAKARVANPARQPPRGQPRTANPARQTLRGHPRTPNPARPAPHAQPRATIPTRPTPHAHPRAPGTDSLGGKACRDMSRRKAPNKRPTSTTYNMAFALTGTHTNRERTGLTLLTVTPVASGLWPILDHYGLTYRVFQPFLPFREFLQFPLFSETHLRILADLRWAGEMYQDSQDVVAESLLLWALRGKVRDSVSFFFHQSMWPEFKTLPRFSTSFNSVIKWPRTNFKILITGFS
ncbi:hypothetical protein DFH07DRAFT_945985 [Mycena maculata]|uniref:Uncharacterized protein n=1 Tax=Mycena maculata TaxID=230809 RepID=A0AAD7MPZ2_9AGAR|nr:hypothetical protein DFH07DRAFT_945985 [Mycena maculata]